MTRRLTFLLAITALVAACSPPASARFEVSDVQKHQECFDLAFPFDPVFLASRSRDESVGIFFQSRGGNFQFVDLIHFEVFGTGNLPIGEPIEMDPIVMNATRVASDLVLGRSCPEMTDSLGLTGTITFDEFSQEIDGVIAGSVDGSVVSLRSGDTVAGSLTGGSSS